MQPAPVLIRGQTSSDDEEPSASLAVLARVCALRFALLAAARRGGSRERPSAKSLRLLPSGPDRVGEGTARPTPAGYMAARPGNGKSAKTACATIWVAGMAAEVAMKMAMAGKRTIATAALAFLLLIASKTQAQALQKNERMRIEMVASDKLSKGQTVKLTPADILGPLHTAPTAADINVVAAAEDAKLIVSVSTYDSGPYLGFAKTARMTLDYALQRAAVAEPIRWSADCEGRAAVNMRSSPERNRTAVQICLASLATGLATALSGEPAQVIVN